MAMLMTTYKISGQFQWRDKHGLLWSGHMEEDPAMLTWRVKPEGHGGRYVAYVRTLDFDSGEQLPMAYLTDVRINKRMENRGAGSMLVRRAIEECKRRGHKGMEGDLSDVDRDHFDKLKYLYEKLGFTVTFFDREPSEIGKSWAGKIEIIFGETKTS